MKELLSAFLINFFAELGDKTQLLALLLASRFGFSTVFAGISLAIVLLQLMAVLLGSAAALIVKNKIILNSVAALIFLLFAYKQLSNKDDEDETDRFNGKFSSPILISFVMMFTAELGDKTQIATLTKAATTTAPIMTYTGAVLGMMLSNIIGISFGYFLKNRVKKENLKIAGGIIFLIFGILYLYAAVSALL